MDYTHFMTMLIILFSSIAILLYYFFVYVQIKKSIVQLVNISVDDCGEFRRLFF